MLVFALQYFFVQHSRPGPRTPSRPGLDQGLDVQELVDSVSYLDGLNTFEAAGCGLTGVWMDIQKNSESYADCQLAIWPSMGFQGILSLDLSGNGITSVRTAPPPKLSTANLASNNISEIDAGWVNLGQMSSIASLSLVGNPSLPMAVSPPSTMGCAAGSGWALGHL